MYKEATTATKLIVLKADEITQAVESTGFKIIEAGPLPDGVFLLESGFLKTRPNEIMNVLPVQVREMNIPKHAKLVTSDKPMTSDKNGRRNETLVQLGVPILVWNSVYFEMVPPFPYIPLLLSIEASREG